MKHRYFTLATFVIYIVVMTAILIWQGIGIAPDRYALILLLGALLVRRSREFLLDWIPFLFILISYDFLRGFADNVSGRVHVTELIQADSWLFQGTIPTVYLQNMFYNGTVQLHDIIATIFYFMHFALPLAFGFLLWLNSKDRFRQFVIGILLLSYGGWISYLIYPAAPPWMAKDLGVLPGAHKIIDQTLSLFPPSLELPTIYHNFNPNPVAAIPSMHAAYPTLVFLFSLAFFKLKALFFLPYVALVWISMVYLGEHYVIDLLLGALYAIIFFFVGKFIYAKIVKTT